MRLIDARNGTVLFGSVAIEPGWTRAEIFNSPVGSVLQRLDRLGSVFKVGPVLFEDRVLVGAIGVELDRTTFILLESSMPGESWDDWSRDREAERKRYHEAVLTSDLGPPHYEKPDPLEQPLTGTLATIVGWTFSWGTVESKYERIDSQSRVIVRPA